ncbi:MAG: cytochrome C [Ideonella sp.]|nr:cytochrome C [Ideonella sp.]MBL0151382.1 cytochrome C [Ideonella sp.]
MRAVAALLVLSGLAIGAQAQSQDAQRLRLRSLASSCAQCHGTDGHAVEGEALIRLAGLPADYTLNQLLAFRTGERKATIMHQITKGYSQDQLESLAKYFATQK